MREKRLILGYLACAIGCAQGAARQPTYASANRAPAPLVQPRPTALERARGEGLTPDHNGTRSAGSDAVTALPDGMVLPRLVHGVSASGDGLRVYISRSGLYLGPERQRVVGLGPNGDNDGYGVSNKSQPNGLLVLPFAATLRSRGEPKQANVLLFADGATPYRVLMETLFTLAKSEYERFLLVGQRAGSSEFVGLETKPPPMSDTTPIAIYIVNFGYTLRVNDQRVGADCGKGPQEGMAVPRIGNQLDQVGLGLCLQRWLSGVAERRVNITANPATPLTEVLETAETVADAGAPFAFKLAK